MPTEGVKPFDPRAECAEPKAVYDACFKKWYSSKFLKVRALGDVAREGACSELTSFVL